ncbi:hypothetical protein [Marinibacterium sp. SX1]|uniref:hypothetical protein n=1 Tax=Marinibacterium sp. SX1 TaxID=3388424 RepID=UPI003D171C21
MRADPVRAIKALSEACARDGHDSLSYKIFPAHLKRDALEPFMAREGTMFVVVKRLLIDCYISSRKAMALQTWTGANTTGQKITLDFADYDLWFQQRRDWYDWIDGSLSKLDNPHCILTYEADINCEASEHLAVALDALAGMGLDKTVSGQKMTSNHTKQDKAANYHQKVSNWREFCAEARTAGKIETLFSYG